MGGKGRGAEVLIPDLEEAPRFVVAVVNRAQGCGVERGHIVDHEAVEVTAAGDFEANGPHAIHALGDGVDRGRALFFRGADHEGHVFSLRGVESEYDGFGKCLVAWWHGCGWWMNNGGALTDTIPDDRIFSSAGMGAEFGSRRAVSCRDAEVGISVLHC